MVSELNHLNAKIKCHSEEKRKVEIAIILLYCWKVLDITRKHFSGGNYFTEEYSVKQLQFRKRINSSMTSANDILQNNKTAKEK